MTSHGAQTLLEHRPGSAPGRTWVKLRLQCGCEVEREVAADRLCETVDGRLLPVGKYPCPVGHPVRRP